MKLLTTLFIICATCSQLMYNLCTSYAQQQEIYCENAVVWKLNSGKEYYIDSVITNSYVNITIDEQNNTLKTVVSHNNVVNTYNYQIIKKEVAKEYPVYWLFNHEYSSLTIVSFDEEFFEIQVSGSDIIWQYQLITYKG